MTTSYNFWARIQDMFSIFREWYLLYRLRRSHLRERMKLERVGLLTKENTCTHLETFLNKISRYRFLLFRRSENARTKRKARDNKILEKSANRTPPFVERTNILGVYNHALSLRVFRQALTPEQRVIDLSSVSDSVWEGLEYDKDDVMLYLTGDGDQFTLPVACSEFVNKHYLFFGLIASILIFVSTPFYEPVKDVMVQWWYEQGTQQVSQPAP